MYKLVAIDLDGTLLNDRKEIPLETKEFLKKIKDNVKVVIATGRPLFLSKDFFYELGLIEEKDYTILSNGAAVVENLSNNVVFSQCLENHELLELINLAQNLDVVISLYTLDCIITNKIMMGGLKENIKLLSDKPEADLKNKNVFKAVFIGKKDEIKVIRNGLSEGLFDKYEIVSSIPEYLEFTKRGMNKAVALDFVCEKYGIDSSEVIAIGDSENDKKMLEYAGCGVAMGNASDEVKKLADIVTATNNEEGVKKILLKLI